MTGETNCVTIKEHYKEPFKEIIILDQDFEKAISVTTVISCDYHEVERLIDRHYGESAGFSCKFELPPTEERGGDGYFWNLDIDNTEVDEYDAEYLSPTSRGQYRQYSTQTLLQNLCYRGVIKPGEYLISISW